MVANIVGGLGFVRTNHMLLLHVISNGLIHTQSAVFMEIFHCLSPAMYPLSSCKFTPSTKQIFRWPLLFNVPASLYREERVDEEVKGYRRGKGAYSESRSVDVHPKPISTNDVPQALIRSIAPIPLFVVDCRLHSITSSCRQ